VPEIDSSALFLLLYYWTEEKPTFNNFYIMKRTNFLLLFVCISLSGFSQVMDVNFQQFYDDFDQLQRFFQTSDSQYDGSPYLNDEFTKGTIILSDGKKYENILLRYNIYNDMFEFQKGNEALSIDKDKHFSCFTYGIYTFKYFEFEYKSKIESGYLEQVIEGDFSLYMKHIVILKDAEESGAYQEATNPTFYSQKPIFMIGNGPDRIVEIKNSKDLNNKFKELEETINNYTGNKKLKLKSKDDFIELINYLNSKG
jgi:hypothetical protein